MLKMIVSNDQVEISKESIRLRDMTIEFDKITSYRVPVKYPWFIRNAIELLFPTPSIELFLKDKKIINIISIYRPLKKLRMLLNRSQTMKSEEEICIKNIEKAVAEKGVQSVFLSRFETIPLIAYFAISLPLFFISMLNPSLHDAVFNLPFIFLLGYFVLLFIVRKTIIVK